VIATSISLNIFIYHESHNTQGLHTFFFGFFP